VRWFFWFLGSGSYQVKTSAKNHFVILSAAKDLGFLVVKLAGRNTVLGRVWRRFVPIWLLLALIPGKKAQGAEFFPPGVSPWGR
jgi:hypothetical protein